MFKITKNNLALCLSVIVSIYVYICIYVDVYTSINICMGNNCNMD